MKRNFLILVVLFFLFCHSVYAQTFPKVNVAPLKATAKENSSAKNNHHVSPHTSLLINQLKDADNSRTGFSKKEKQQFLLKMANGAHYVNALMKVSNDNDAHDLEKMGIAIGTKAGNIWTLKIPLDQLENLVEEGNFEYLQIDEPVKAQLENALTNTQVDKVHRGEELILPVKGEGVVIGIVDFGFDYAHPLFYTADGGSLRIKRVWIQDEEGLSPEGFDYGSEYVEEEQILGILYDQNHISHGTHVASIATGSGYRHAGYTGVAPAAELVFVTPQNGDQQDFLNTGQSSIVDAINYVFQYAASVHKPAVVNLSLGTHIGPHDGTSLFDQAIDNLTGTGKIVVGAAGNEGMVNMHIKNDFSAKQSFSTYFNYNGTEIGGFIDSWGEPGMDFCFNILLVDPQDGSIIDETGDVCANQNANEEFELIEEEEGFGVNVNMFSSESEFNEKPRILVFYENLSGNHLLLEASGTEGSLHLWNVGSGRGSDFIALDDEAIDGDNLITMSEIGGTGKNIISVGAFTTKNSYQNLSNRAISQNTSVGEIAPFSSKGPAADDRIKPDLTAPGNVVVAAVNSYDNMYKHNSSNVVDELEHEGRTYYFAAFEGTSMSAPMVTGLIALMLEVNPLLDPETAKSLLQESNTKDDFTGGTPNYTWGYGKMNALKTLQNTSVFTKVNLSEKATSKFDYLIYPNPNQGEIVVASLSAQASAQIKMELMSLQGQMITTTVIDEPDLHKKWSYKLPDVRNGIYMLRISDGKKTEQQKIIISK